MRFGKIIPIFSSSLLVLLLSLLCSCGGSQPPISNPPPPEPVLNPADVSWPMERGGLRYKIEASEDLNLYKGCTHGLTVCVYQLKETDDFMAKASTSAGIDMLLDASLEKVKAVGVKSYYIQPGSIKKLTLDRAAGASALGVVAGYAHLSPDMCVAVLPFPMHIETKGIIFRDTVYSAAKADILIYLGAEAVSLSGVEHVQ